MQTTGGGLTPGVRIENNVIDGLHLAFVAHNSPDWAEFIVNQPTALTEEISVHHYSNPVRVEGRNRMYVVNDA